MIFALWEDIVDCKPKMLLVLFATLMQLDMAKSGAGAGGGGGAAGDDGGGACGGASPGAGGRMSVVKEE